MRYLMTFFSLFIYGFSFTQVKSDEYLKENRVDLLEESKIEIGQAKIIGFGAIHGSSKTEEVELILLKELANNHSLKYYLPETDYSTANYFQEYIETGNEILLKELVEEYGAMVGQEKSIEVFEKWKSLRPMFLKKNIKVLGIDRIASYKFSVNELLSITKENEIWGYRDSLSLILEDPKTGWSVLDNPETKSLLKNFVEEYEKNRINYQSFIKDSFSFNHIIKNIKHTYQTYSREPFIYDNYLIMKNKYSLETSLHFARFGIGHIMKSKINNTASFFSMLREGNIYKPSEILTIQGFLTKSSVLWRKFDRKGNLSYTTKKGFGIGDYWLEYFYKINNLKKNKLSDITLFYLNRENSPYSKKDEFKLIKIKTLVGKSHWYPTKGKNTLDYIDYAILISNSVANQPIEELQ